MKRYDFDEMFYGRRYGFDQPDEHWVDPNRTDGKRTHPYSYSEFYLWGYAAGKEASTDAVYSDRLAQWGREKFERCFREVAPNKGWDRMSSAEVSKWLTSYFGRPITATAVAEGCNVSSGYPYWIIWFREATPSLALPASAIEGGTEP